MTTKKVQEILIKDERTPWFNIHSAYDEMPLTLEAFRVLGHLSRRSDNENRCAYPSYSSIGESCFRASYPKSSTATLRRKAIKAINELIGYGLIRKEVRLKEGSNEHIGNAYILTHSSAWDLGFSDSQNARTCKGTRERKASDSREGSAGLTLGSAGLTPPKNEGGGAELTLGSAGLTPGGAGLTPGGAGPAPKGYPEEGIPEKGIPEEGIPERTPLYPPKGETQNFGSNGFVFDDDEDCNLEEFSTPVSDEQQQPEIPLTTNQAVADDKCSAARPKPKKITKPIFERLAATYNDTKAERWAECKACNDTRLKLAQRLWDEVGGTLDEAIAEAQRIITLANAVVKVDLFWGQKVEGTIETLFRDRRYQQLVEKGEAKGINARAVHESGLTVEEIEQGRKQAEFMRALKKLEQDEERRCPA